MDDMVRQLRKMGISKAIVGRGTVNGKPAVALRWDGATDYFFGYDEYNFGQQLETETRLARFKDENLQ